MKDYTYQLVIETEVKMESNNLTCLRAMFGNNPQVKIFTNGKENPSATRAYFSKFRLGN